MSDETSYDTEVQDRYAAGDAAGMLEVEYRQLLQTVAHFSERAARQRLAADAPSALDIVSHLAAEMLPDGAAPSLSDALHALDRAYAGWQGEEAAWQHLQARHLAYHLGELVMLRHGLARG